MNGVHLGRTASRIVALVLCGIVTACSGSSDGDGERSVFSVAAGECYSAPAKVQAELTSLKTVSCKQPHTHEAYAVVGYRAVKGSQQGADEYPGSKALATFAQGACAQRFTAYVGISYLDSKYFFTYLVPSVRSWQSERDRRVTCFVTTNGGTLSHPVKGTRK